MPGSGLSEQPEEKEIPQNIDEKTSEEAAAEATSLADLAETERSLEENKKFPLQDLITNASKMDYPLQTLLNGAIVQAVRANPLTRKTLEEKYGNEKRVRKELQDLSDWAVAEKKFNLYSLPTIPGAEFETDLIIKAAEALQSAHPKVIDQMEKEGRDWKKEMRDFLNNM